MAAGSPGAAGGAENLAAAEYAPALQTSPAAGRFCPLRLQPHCLVGKIPKRGMDLAVGLDHAQDLVRIEHTDVVFGVCQRERARGAVPAKFAHWAFGFGAVDQRAHAEAIAVALLVSAVMI